MKATQKNYVLKLVETAMLAALAVVLMLVIRFPLLPSAAFLEFDMGDMPVIISTLLFGPGAGLITLFIVSLIQALTVSASSGWVGFVMHFIASGAYVLALGFIRKNRSSIKSLIIGVSISTIIMTILMVPLNLIFTTFFLNTSFDAVLQMIVPVILPFNLLKGIINSVVSVLVYIPLYKILDKSHLLPTK